MSEDKNKPSSGSLFKSKFKLNDGSEEDNKRETYYGTYRDESGKVWKLSGYVNKSEYGSWLKVYTREITTQSAPSSNNDFSGVSNDDPDDEIPF